jgi:hypothetical protein
MTTEHEEAVRLAEKHGARVARAPEPFPDVVVMEPAQLAALVADVRQQAMEEAAEICKQLYLHEDIDNSARDCYDAIRARLEEGK